MRRSLRRRWTSDRGRCKLSRSGFCDRAWGMNIAETARSAFATPPELTMASASFRRDRRRLRRLASGAGGAGLDEARRSRAKSGWVLGTISSTGWSPPSNGRQQVAGLRQRSFLESPRWPSLKRSAGNVSSLAPPRAAWRCGLPATPYSPCPTSQPSRHVLQDVRRHDLA